MSSNTIVLPSASDWNLYAAKVTGEVATDAVPVDTQTLPTDSHQPFPSPSWNPHYTRDSSDDTKFNLSSGFATGLENAIRRSNNIHDVSPFLSTVPTASLPSSLCKVTYDILCDVWACDKARYFHSAFRTIRATLILGVNFGVSCGSNHMEKSDEKNSQAMELNLAWLENAIIYVLEQALLTNYLSTDIATSARQIWQSMPEIWHKHGITPQRPYLRYGNSIRELEKFHKTLSPPVEEDKYSPKHLYHAVKSFDVDHGNTFGSGVDAIPGYSKVVPFPMDLIRIDASVKAGTEYATVYDLFHDVQLMLTNGKIYNAPDTPYYSRSAKLETFLKRYMDDLFDGHVTDESLSLSEGSSFRAHYQTYLKQRVLCARLRLGNKEPLSALPKKITKYVEKVKNILEREWYHSDSDADSIHLDFSCIECVILDELCDIELESVEHMVRQVLRITPQGRMYLNTHPFFTQSQK